MPRPYNHPFPRRPTAWICPISRRQNAICPARRRDSPEAAARSAVVKGSGKPRGSRAANWAGSVKGTQPATASSRRSWTIQPRRRQLLGHGIDHPHPVLRQQDVQLGPQAAEVGGLHLHQLPVRPHQVNKEFFG